MAAFFAYNAWQFGDGTAFVQAQRMGWTRARFFDLVSFWRGFVYSIETIPAGCPQCLSFPYLYLLLFVVAAIALRRVASPLNTPWMAYMWASLAMYVGTAVGPFDGGTRYMMVLVPAYVVFAQWGCAHPRLGRLLLGCFAVCAAINAAFFTLRYWVF
jgi:hypothetical protein